MSDDEDEDTQETGRQNDGATPESGVDEPVDAEDLDEVIEEIETKLERLDERRRDLEDKIELKRSRVREINETIQNLEEIEADIDETDESND